MRSTTQSSEQAIQSKSKQYSKKKTRGSSAGVQVDTSPSFSATTPLPSSISDVCLVVFLLLSFVLCEGHDAAPALGRESRPLAVLLLTTLLQASLLRLTVRGFPFPSRYRLSCAMTTFFRQLRWFSLPACLPARSLCSIVCNCNDRTVLFLLRLLLPSAYLVFFSATFNYGASSFLLQTGSAKQPTCLAGHSRPMRETWRAGRC